MNIMNLNDEQRKRLEEELQSLRNTPVKPCKWSLKNRLEYGTFWAMGFLIGLREGLNMR